MKTKVLLSVVTILLALLQLVGCNMRFGQEDEIPTSTETATLILSPSDYVNYKWITYTPSNYNPDEGITPTIGQINGDLYLLKASGFTGIVTTNSSEAFALIPELARGQGFEGVLMGIYDPKDTAEIDRALLKQEFVDGYVLGHGGLGVDYTLEDLQNAVARLHASSSVSIGIMEKSVNFTLELTAVGSFNAPLVHPYEDGIQSPISAANYSVNEYIHVRDLDASKITMLFGAGYPTDGGDMTNDEMQYSYYQNMPVDFAWAFDEAFDQAWRTEPTRQHYGLFDSDKNPKMYMAGNPFDPEP